MKMMDEEGGHKGREEDIEKKDCSLSCEGWIMLLSHEIYRQERSNNRDGFTQTLMLLMTVLFAFMGWMFAARSTNLPVHDLNRALFVLQHLTCGVAALLAVYILGGICILLTRYPKTKKRVKSLENFRKEIILRKLTDSNEIHEQWDKINKM
jgi:uncharacterized membrane protein